MDSSSTTDAKVIWQEGDRCIAPNPKDGSLQEATIQSLLSSSTHNHEDTTVLVKFINHNIHDDDADAEKEVTIPVSKLQRAGSGQISHEKPLFPSLNPLGTAVHLVLSLGEKVPYTVNRYLRDYQRDGIKFIHENVNLSRGCILGDDMGLGKTVQVIGFLSAVLHKTGTWEDVENNKPRFLRTQSFSEQRRPSKVFLIVAPLSVMYNWKEELDTWGHFQCVVIHGLRKEEELSRIRDGRFEVALTTYETLRLCLDQFNSIDWSAVIVDEVHKLKNPKSQITQAMKELKCKVRIGLTGTILQNNLEEFWCVMDWAIPACLGSLGNFKNRYSDPVEQGQKHSATKRSLATARRAVRGLATRVSPWFLRRTKALIKDQLPKKDDRVVYCALTDFQRSVYQTVLDTEDVMLILRSSDKCDCQSGRTRRSCCYKTNSAGVEVKVLYFSYLTILRKVANHVALLRSTDGTSKKQKDLVGAVCEKVFQKFPDFLRRCKEEAFEAISDPMYSGKMKVLQKLLRHYMKRRDKVLIFSLSTKLLDVLVSYCMAEGLEYNRLDGNTKAKDRVKIVKDFNSSPHTNLCLVSTMAGGLGLNFVGANVVVLFDPTWNPANDLQAIDRAYRIGQWRDVTVLRLISLGTVEEIIYLRQVYKQQLQSTVVDRESARRYFEAVQGTDGHQGELFGTKNLFRLQTQGTCLTRQLLEREGRVEAGVVTASTHAGGADGGEEAGGEEETGESGKPAPADASKQNSPPGEGSNTPSSRGVLDFSSGSEEDDVGGNIRRRKGAELRGEDGNNANTASSRPNLLHCGFSRLLTGGAQMASSGVEDSSLSEGESGGGGGGGVEERSTKKKQKEVEEGCTSQGSSSGTPGNGVSVKGGVLPDTSGGSGGEGRLRRWTSAKRAEGMRRTGSDEARAAPRGRHGTSDTDESDDLGEAVRGGERGGANRTNRKKPAVRARSKHTEHIETFTSSEEEHTPVKKGRSARADGSRALTDGGKTPKMADTLRPHGSKSVSFTSLKPQTHRDGTIDTVLGGVSEVLYTHSNQRVVGGSKAEERISRAAVRDVFDRRMYSQFPANHLVGTQESESSEGPPASAAAREEGERSRAGASGLRAQHPVTSDRQAVHHGREDTFILGQTPQAIRRQQLDQMASELGMSSVRAFAEDVLSSSSGQRLAWLRRYYSSLDRPDLADMVANWFPEPSVGQSTSVVRPPSSPAPKPKCRRKVSPQKARGDSKARETPLLTPQKSPRIPQGRVAVGGRDIARGRKRTHRASVSSSAASRAAGVPCSDPAGSSSLEPCGEAAALDPAASGAAVGRTDRACPPSPHREAPSPSDPRSILTELIGDTSILDDLFRPTSARGAPQRRLAAASPSQTPRPCLHADGSDPATQARSAPPPPPRHTAGRRDFWDILNEGSEESLERLTDLSVLERVRGRTARPDLGASGEGGGSALWKTNDKFLWKK
ncbi:DNA excision repair protein ERCC-6-like 2 isoform X1 [Gadus morhua]|uniref:DNA excision repair protein ERCC-6-like 2 isoform X1 n=1 Tax=Gadus morhua TaxID=8049 RepID=UPI0011B7D0A3|nr:DNA excision repair protein ERCC-6-like 2 isoform X1 [Gadus morhua]